MGDIGQPTPTDREEIRRLAHRIVDAVNNDEESPLATHDSDDVLNEWIPSLAQEILLLQVEHELHVNQLNEEIAYLRSTRKVYGLK